MSFEVSIDHRIGERQITLAFASDAPLTALVGPSGAGKTTVLNCIAGLIRPDRGRIAVAGSTLFESATGVNLRPERRRAGYVFQDFRLFPHLRVAANLAYGERLARPEDRWITRDEVTGFSASATCCSAGQRRCRAAKCAGWQSAARCWRHRASCCSTSRSRRSTPSAPRR
jgi:molybdate transport system ATP-binding protein